MLSKLRKKWKILANDLNQANIKNPILKKMSIYISWLMVNTFIFINTMAASSFVLFAIAFSIDDDNIVGDYVFISALLAFSPIVMMAICGIIYTLIYLPIKFLINKVK